MSEQPAPSLLEALWRYRWSSSALVLALAALSAVAGLVSGPAAVVTARISLSPPTATSVLAPGATGDASSARYTAQRAAFITSDAVLTAVTGRVGDVDLTTLRREVEANPAAGENTVVVTVTAASPEEAVALAEAVVESYAEQTEAEVERLSEAALDSLAESEAEVLSSGDGAGGAGSAAATLSDLRLQASEIRSDSALFGDGVTFVESPDIDAVQTRGLPLRETALGVVVGLVLAGVLAWVRADRHRRVGGPQEHEGDAPLLGTLRSPEDVEVPEGVEVLEMPTASHRLVGAAVGRDLSTGVLAVTATDGELRTATVLNLAASLAREGRRVAVVDGDLRRCRLSQVLAAPGAPWTEPRRDGRGPRPTDLLRTAGGHEVAVVTARPLDETSEGPARGVVEERVARWRSTYDVVLLDLPPVGTDQLAYDLAAAADAGLLVVAQGDDSRWLPDEVRQWAALGTRVVGYVYADASTRGRARFRSLR
ncbi:hypothetical protein [Pseudokineococcus sp. 1T1Z-3]|uniref:hypothetical protein n=1 Tax=Pseudokineococcus sp. 1T1Z-3 TaxID=3132745 RepID=UPI00309F1388